MSSKLSCCIKPPAISLVNRAIHPIPPTYQEPVLKRYFAFPTIDWPFPYFVILQPGINIIWLLHINRYIINLSKRNIIKMVGIFPFIPCDIKPAIAANHRMPRVLGVDPHCAEITKNTIHYFRPFPACAGPGFPAVIRVRHPH